MRNEGRHVLGHSCDGLLAHIDASYPTRCKPVLGEDGRLHGCDDEAEHVIRFCPFCGAALAEGETERSDES